MADLKDVVSEFETIANLGTNDIKSFKYGNEFELNEARTKVKPILLFHKQRAFTYRIFERKHKDYTITIGLYDQYNSSEKSTTDFVSKQLYMEDLMEKLIRTFRSRYLADASNKTWFMLSNAEDSVSGELIEVIGVDKLIGITATFVVRVFTDCDTL
jgi:hypothetical protein